MCRVFYYHSYGSSILSAYLVTAIAMDRLVAIKFPIAHRNNSSKQTADKIALAAVGSAYFVSIPVLYFYGHNEDKICAMLPKNFPVLLDYFNFTVNNILFFGLPFCSIVIANIMFVRELRNRKQSKRNETKGANPTDEKTKREQQKLQAERNYVIMLLFLTCSFLVFSLSVAITNFLYVYMLLSDEYAIEQAFFVGTLSATSMLMNNSLNFIFYYLSGKMFREACRKAVKSIFGLH